MWRVCVAFLGHRIVLLLAAFLIINSNIPSTGSGSLPQIHSTGQLWSIFLQRTAEGPEFAELNRLMPIPMGQVFSATRHPFLWLPRWLAGVTGISPTLVLLLVSNLFVLLFLSELVALLSRMVPTDVAEGAAILMILWPTSYEMSLGASLSLMAYLTTLILRQAIDNRWLIAGVGMGILMLMEPLAIGLVPILLYIFWYYQRHFQLPQVIKRTCFFLIPFGLAIFTRWGTYPTLGQIFSGSALFNVIGAAKGGSSIGWTVSRSYGGQTVTILFFGIGALFSALSNNGLMHRMIPINMWLVLLLFSPYGTVASRVAIAAACLEGIASASSPVVMRVVQGLLLCLGIYEVVLVFGGSIGA